MLPQSRALHVFIKTRQGAKFKVRELRFYQRVVASGKKIKYCSVALASSIGSLQGLGMFVKPTKKRKGSVYFLKNFEASKISG